ncbi:MAG TPA: hypothetical protein ENG42_01270 [Candidatus Aenigmarchaeota archaeon]|nr:MAG: hypothetical protein DRP03_00040 [Candidatus Aenigmarchaeota archaeon]HDD46080.1 hypothetical protein [Candidatus Aenigmarchaeota archaeon]
MNERTLVRCCVVGIISGIILIYFLSKVQVYQHIDIGKINRNYIGQVVNITGEVKRVKNKNGNLFVTVADESGEVLVVIWKSIAEASKTKGNDLKEMKVGDNVTIIGEVSMYKGRLEIIPISTNIYLHK